MQDTSWYALVAVQARTPHQYMALAAVEDRDRVMALVTNANANTRRAQTYAQEKPSNLIGDERDFLDSLGMKRKPVPSKAEKVKPRAARYQQ